MRNEPASSRSASCTQHVAFDHIFLVAFSFGLRYHIGLLWRGTPRETYTMHIPSRWFSNNSIGMLPQTPMEKWMKVPSVTFWGISGLTSQCRGSSDYEYSASYTPFMLADWTIGAIGECSILYLMADCSLNSPSHHLAVCLLLVVFQCFWRWKHGHEAADCIRSTKYQKTPNWKRIKWELAMSQRLEATCSLVLQQSSLLFFDWPYYWIWYYVYYNCQRIAKSNKIYTFQLHCQWQRCSL